MIPKYLYLYVSISSSIIIHYQNPNPTVVRSSLHARMLLFLPAVAFLVHAFFPKISFLSALACFQQVPNNNMWLVLSHLTQIFDLPRDLLELLFELYFLCLCLHSILLECVHYLDYNFIIDQFHTFCLGLCYMCLGFLFLYPDLCYPLLKWFHLSPTLLLLCLHNGEFYM